MDPFHELPNGFSFHDGLARFSLRAELTLDEAVERVNDAIRYCRQNKISGVLIDITQLTGFDSPSLVDRFWFVSKWAETAAGRVAMAMVTRPELIAPDKIGITIAENRGFHANVFTDVEEAGQWLRSLR